MAAHIPFEITTAEEPGGVHRLRVTGELDLATVPALREALDRAKGSVREIVLDLEGVRFLDSTAMAMLVEVDAESHTEGFGLAIVPSPAVTRLAELCGLEDVLPLRT